MSGMPAAKARLGFGCASLGSRMGARQGLVALARAYDSGVTWFDLAPSYGDGHAETIFSAFARGRRQNLHVTTKVGLVPPSIGSLTSAVKPLVRRAVALFPGLRRITAKRGGATAVALDRAAIMSGIEGSLSRLGIDYVDSLLLHDVSPETVAKDEVLRALEDVVASGKARQVGVAGSFEVALAARPFPLLSHLQFADNPLEGKLLEQEFAAARSDRLVAVHSIHSGLRILDTWNPCQLATLGDELGRVGYAGPVEATARAAFLDYALAACPGGTVLLSMFKAEHLSYAVDRRNRPPATPQQLAAIFRAAREQAA